MGGKERGHHQCWINLLGTCGDAARHQDRCRFTKNKRVTVLRKGVSILMNKAVLSPNTTHAVHGDLLVKSQWALQDRPVCKAVKARWKRQSQWLVGKSGGWKARSEQVGCWSLEAAGTQSGSMTRCRKAKQPTEDIKFPTQQIKEMGFFASLGS